MGKRRTTSKKPLEWVFNSIQTTDDTVTQDRIELGLKDDEVAEIHRVDSLIDHGILVDDQNNSVTVNMMLSMDPDINIARDPAVAVNHEDLESFFENQCSAQQEAAAAATAAMEKRSTKQTQDFDPPVLVGTDVGHIMHTEYAAAAVSGQSWVRLYFTRRKANVMELNQILLKRR